MCDKIARIVPIRQINGLPTVPVSSDPRNGDWIETDIFIGEFAMDVNTGLVYTRSSTGINGVSAGTGQFIPLSGTEVGNPVTEDIEMTLFKGFKWIDNDGYLNKITFEDRAFQMNIYDSDLNIIRVLEIGYNGISSSQYFQPDPLFSGEQFIQQKYVDNTMIPLDYGDTENVGGIENVQVYTTGTGTGIASVDLSPTMAIGKDVTVSDLGNNASTHNIQIDSGSGNTILYNGVATQDITLNTDGASVTIRKITANQFMVIAKN